MYLDAYNLLHLCIILDKKAAVSASILPVPGHIHACMHEYGDDDGDNHNRTWRLSRVNTTGKLSS